MLGNVTNTITLRNVVSNLYDSTGKEQDLSERRPAVDRMDKLRGWASRPVNAISISAILALLLLFPFILFSSDQGNVGLIKDGDSSSADKVITGQDKKVVKPPTPVPPQDCSPVSSFGPKYELDPLSYPQPDLFDGEDEVFECECSHWRTNVCTLKGDVRLDARRNLAMLYARKKETRRGVQVVKAYTRKWETEMMTTDVQDVVIKSVSAPPDLDLWSPTDPENDDESPRGGHRGIDPALAKTNWDIPIELGNSTDWNPEKWREKVAKRLWKGENQLSEIELEREQVGQTLLSKGGALEKEGPHGWIIFNRTKNVTAEEMQSLDPVLKCDVRHSVPGVVLSTAGWTGNIYHEFNDGLIPLYITGRPFNKEYVIVVQQAKLWWFVKYEYVLGQLSNYPAVLLGKENLTHCFPHLIVGLRIHDELSVYPQLIGGKVPGSIQEFQTLLRRAWGGADWNKRRASTQPLVSLISRSDKTRVVTNEDKLVQLAEELGFRVQVLNPKNSAPLEELLFMMQFSDLMIGVHGAAMTHFLFMAPNSSFVQILPLGTDWPAKTYYGDPAIRLGLHYLEYKVGINESSLSQEYPRNHSVLVNPDSVMATGWSNFKDIYLENQNVTLDLGRMKVFLEDVLKQYRSTASVGN